MKTINRESARRGNVLLRSPIWSASSTNHQQNEQPDGKGIEHKRRSASKSPRLNEVWMSLEGREAGILLRR